MRVYYKYILSIMAFLINSNLSASKENADDYGRDNLKRTELYRELEAWRADFIPEKQKRYYKLDQEYRPDVDMDDIQSEEDARKGLLTKWADKDIAKEYDKKDDLSSKEARRAFGDKMIEAGKARKIFEKKVNKEAAVNISRRESISFDEVKTMDLSEFYSDSIIASSDDITAENMLKFNEIFERFPNTWLIIDFKNAIKIPSYLGSHTSSLEDRDKSPRFIFPQKVRKLKIKGEKLKEIGQFFLSIGDPNKQTLEEVVLPDGIESIDDYFLHNRASLKKITLPKKLRKIGIVWLGGGSLDNLTLPDALETIHTFEFGIKVKSLKLPNGIVRIEGSNNSNESLFKNVQELIVDPTSATFKTFMALPEADKNGKPFNNTILLKEKIKKNLPDSAYSQVKEEGRALNN